MAETAASWISRLASELGVDEPSPEEIEDLLALAGTAAHASERSAAPISTWLAARAGVSPAQALSAAKRLSG